MTDMSGYLFGANPQMTARRTRVAESSLSHTPHPLTPDYAVAAAAWRALRIPARPRRTTARPQARSPRPLSAPLTPTTPARRTCSGFRGRI